MIPRIEAEVLGAEPGAVEVDVRVSETPAGASVTVVSTCRSATPVAASIRVSAIVEAALDPWWFLPGLFYGDNGPLDNARPYPRYAAAATDAADHARFVSSAWELRADRAAAGLVCCWPAAGEAGWALSAPPETSAGVTGLGFSHGAAEADARIWIGLPAREHPVSYYGDADAREPFVETLVLAPGEVFQVELCLHRLGADRPSAATALLRRLRDDSLPHAPVEPWVDVPTAARLAAEGLLRWHYDPDPGVLLETVGFDREVSGHDGQPVDRQAMHIGWVSGIPWAYAMLRHARRTGAAELEAAATAVIDFCAAAVSPSGTSWGVWYRDRGWTSSWSTLPHGLHSRTLGEATQFLLRAAALADRDDWRERALANLRVVADRQRPDGALGSVHDALTGEVLQWDGTAGLGWVGALAEAQDERMLAVAERAGAYYAPFTESWSLSGAPEDVDRAVTSEDGVVAVMAYLALHRATGGARWLDLARRAADFLLTFRYVYDVRFTPGTLLEVYGFGTRGADQASVSNQHLHAYGLVCTRELLELSDAVGDPHYAERADETLTCFRQFVARFDGDVNAYRGMVTERFYQTDCFQPKGMILTLSHAWSAGALLLGCEDALDLGRVAA